MATLLLPQVVATEVSKSGVAAARSNFELNDVTNVFVARMSSEEFTEAWKTGKAMNRWAALKVCKLEHAIWKWNGSKMTGRCSA